MTTMATEKPAKTMEYFEVHRESWSESRPAQRGAPAGMDYFTRIYERATWPEDGTTLAGTVREHCWLWIGDEPGRRNVVISHSSYPAARSPLADLKPLPDDDEGDPMLMATEKTAGELPKAAKDLLALAAAQGWGAAQGRNTDTGGNPFVTIALRRFAPDWEVKATWHSRATGGKTLRLFSLIWRHVPLQGRGHHWADAPSLKAVRQVLVDNPVAGPFSECRRASSELLWPRNLRRTAA